MHVSDGEEDTLGEMSLYGVKRYVFVLPTLFLKRQTVLEEVPYSTVVDKTSMSSLGFPLILCLPCVL